MEETKAYWQKKKAQNFSLACLLQYIHFTFDLPTPGDPALTPV